MRYNRRRWKELLNSPICPKCLDRKLRPHNRGFISETNRGRPAMRELYMKQGQGFLLVFSITSMSSLNELSELREQIIRIKDDENVPIVIVGNKSDLEEDRAVPRARAFGLSQNWGNAPYYETSARRRANVNEVFIDLCRQIIRKDSEGSRSSSDPSRKREGPNRHDRKRDNRRPRKRGPCVIL
ncbi:unnamed protein product [Penicillium olsonii]|nr:unnamed protein product [Penicillium olsonii]